MSIKEKITQTADVFWNMLGGGLVAMQSAVLLIFVARFYDQDTAGIVSIAYAFAVLAYTIARYGIRNYQVTDQQNEYSFREYLTGRVITITVTVVLMAIYLGVQMACMTYSIEKAVIIIEIVLLRMVNALEDVYLGRFQQVGNFAIGAKIMAIRELALLILLSVLMVIRTNIVVAFLIGIVFSAVIDIIYIRNKRAQMEIDSRNQSTQSRLSKQSVKKMLIDNFPLCLGTGLAVYASNIPKYTTDRYLDEYSQAVVAYLILPVFTIALFSQFAYTPFVKQLGDAYQSGDYKSYRNKIRFQALFTGGLAVVICAVCLLIGLPILSFVYDIDLTVYKWEFIILLIGGALYALEYYLAIPVTIMHKQKQLGLGYVVAIVISVLLQKRIVSSYGIMGVCELYCIVNLVVLLFFAAIIILDLKAKSKSGEIS